MELLVAVALVVIAVLLLNPFHFWMPDMMVMGMLVAALALFAVFASFILREKVVDEREELHRTFAGRNAFLVGAGTLICGIVVQGYTHSVDSWLVFTLIAMLVTKIGTRIWSDKNQ